MHENVYPAGKYEYKKDKVTLILTPLKFYTQDDENIFFMWLGRIKSIESSKGIGRALYVTISSDSISYNDRENLDGLFERYKLKNPDQLKVFKVI